MKAKFALLRVMLEARKGLITVAPDDDGTTHTVRISLNSDKILTVGVPALRRFLLQIQVFKSTANVKAAKSLWMMYTTVPDELLMLREVVLLSVLPKPMYVQPCLRLVQATDDGSGKRTEQQVQLQEFEDVVGADAVIQSTVARYGGMKQSTITANIKRLLEGDKDKLMPYSLGAQSAWTTTTTTATSTERLHHLKVSVDNATGIPSDNETASPVTS